MRTSTVSQFVATFSCAVLVTLTIAPSSEAAIPPGERAALIALYQATGGDEWRRNLRWLDEPGTECAWYGVTCDDQETTVTALHLAYNGLTGDLPADLSGLPNLQELDLELNNLLGPIPPAVAGLSALDTLNLSWNQLSGSIPAEVGDLALLRDLLLEGNSLSGGLPDDLADLANLEHLYLSYNRIEGQVPGELGELRHLRDLFLDHNDMSGEIPPEIFQASRLQRVRLNGNRLSGNVPATVADVVVVDLSANQLSGPLAADFGGSEAVLQHLNLRGNQLSGPLPASMREMPDLLRLDLRWNALYTDDDELRTFIDQRHEEGSFEATQALVPDPISARPAGTDSVLVSWEPIAYTANEGGYRLLYATDAQGPFTVFAETADRTVSSLHVDGLTPGQTYYFQVQSVVGPHAYNPSTVIGDASEAVSTAPAPAGQPGTVELTREEYRASEGQLKRLAVQRLGGSAGAVAVTYSTTPGSADSGLDFLATSGTLEWSDGDASDKAIEVAIVDDAVSEGPETFAVVLSGPAGGAVLGDVAEAMVTIDDNDLTADDEASTNSAGAFPSVTSDPEGGRVVVWSEVGRDGSGTGIFAQRYDQEGHSIAPQIQINAMSEGDQHSAAIDSDATGGFVVVWISETGSHLLALRASGSAPLDNDGNRIVGRIFASDGSPQGGELTVDDGSAGSVGAPAVARWPASGRFFVAWRRQSSKDLQAEGEIVGRFFDGGGNPDGDEVVIDDGDDGEVESPAVGVTDDGGVVAAWEREDPEGWRDIYVVRVDTAGKLSSPVVQVNTDTWRDQTSPAIAVAPGGDFVVAWEGPSLAPFGDREPGTDVFARRFGSAATPEGDAWRVNPDEEGAQSEPQLAMTSTGDCWAVWANEDFAGRGGVFGRFLPWCREPIGVHKLAQEGDVVQLYDPSDDRSARTPRISLAPDGALAAAFVKDDTNEGDGSVLTWVQGLGHVPPIGDAGEHLYLIPAAAHVAGLEGTNWVSDIVIHNPTGGAAAVTAYFLERGQDNSASTGVRVTVGAQQSVKLEDVVEDTFGRTETSGAVLLGSDRELVVTSRTYNDAETGTYGQHVPGIPAAEAVGPGEEVRLIQLTANDRYRTNVGFASLTAEFTTIDVELFGSDGHSVGSGSWTLAPYGYNQVTDIVDAVGGAPVDDAYAIVGSSTPGARYLTYASVIDNRTGDPVLVLPVPSVDASASLTIPAAAAVAGAAGTNWRTDLEVHNPGSVQSSYTVALLPSGQPNPDPLEETFSLAPGLCARYPDILADVFGFTGTAALRMTPSPGEVMVTSRTYNLTPDGTYGQFIAGVAAGRSILAGDEVRLVGLTQDPSYRTNIGFASASAFPIQVELSLYDGDGTLLGVLTTELAANGYWQVNNAFNQVGADALGDGYAVVRTDTLGAAFFAYASRIDNRSGDPVYVPGLGPDRGVPPRPDFTWSPDPATVGEPVQFVDTSSGGPLQWLWNFGDGASSSEPSPTHIYATSGTFGVTLTAANASGSRSITKQVAVGEPPTAHFTWSPEQPLWGVPVVFADASTGQPTSWSWDFGDGSSSEEQSPSHLYLRPGAYEVALAVSNDHGFNRTNQRLTVIAEPSASFDWIPDSPMAGEPVSFFDTSIGPPDTWFWEFGDEGFSYEQSPIHTFTSPGTYEVSLTVSNPLGSSTMTQPVTVEASATPASVISWWSAEGNADDSSGSNHGTWFNGEAYAAGPCGYAFSLDGADDYILVPYSPSLDLGTDDFSIAFWISTTSAGSVAPVLDKRSPAHTGYHAYLWQGWPGVQLAVDESNHQNFWCEEAFVADGSFHFVAITVARGSTSGGRFYVDGQHVASCDFDPTPYSGSLSDSEELVFGRQSDGFGTDLLGGLLDELQLYRGVLTADEVHDLNDLCSKQGTASDPRRSAAGAGTRGEPKR